MFQATTLTLQKFADNTKERLGGITAHAFCNTINTLLVKMAEQHSLDDVYPMIRQAHVVSLEPATLDPLGLDLRFRPRWVLLFEYSITADFVPPALGMIAAMMCWHNINPLEALVPLGLVSNVWLVVLKGRENIGHDGSDSIVGQQILSLEGWILLSDFVQFIVAVLDNVADVGDVLCDILCGISYNVELLFDQV